MRIRARLMIVACGIGLSATPDSLIFAQSTSTEYGILEQKIIQQIDQHSWVAGYSALGKSEFALVAEIDTGGADLSAAPTVQLPNAKTVTFPTGANHSPSWPGGFGHKIYHYGRGFASQAALNTAAGNGDFMFTLGNATEQPVLPLDTKNPQFPVIPLLTSGGIWSGSTLQIDPNKGATLVVNSSSFGTYESGLGGAIQFHLFYLTTYPNTVVDTPVSEYIPSLGKHDPAISTLVIKAGELAAEQEYVLQLDFSQLEGLNTDIFTGTGISGSPIGASEYKTSTFISISTASALPTVTPVVTGKLGTNGWYISKTTTLAWNLTGIPTPIASGCGTVSVPQTAGTNYTCTATNSLGSASDSATIKEDSVKPSVLIKAPAANAVYALKQNVLASYSCTDSTSGVASCAGTVASGVGISTANLGQQTFVVTATDNAGNTITKTVLYNVDPATATPVFSLKAGTYSGAQQVKISDATVGATIYYTLNGTTPTASSAKYTGTAITIGSSATLKARAIAPNDAWSTVRTAVYTIN